MRPVAEQARARYLQLAESLDRGRLHAGRALVAAKRNAQRLQARTQSRLCRPAGDDRRSGMRYVRKRRAKENRLRYATALGELAQLPAVRLPAQPRLGRQEEDQTAWFAG